MSKSMLIFDTPDRCGNCPCCEALSGQNDGRCRIKNKVVKNADIREEWCPIFDLDMQRTDAVVKIMREPLRLHTNPAEYTKQRTEKEIEMGLDRRIRYDI